MSRYLSQIVTGFNKQQSLVCTSSVLRKSLIRNGFCLTTSTNISAEEQKLIEKLKANLNTSAVEVRDISGGCGAMYEISISSIDFRGKSIVKQHRMVTEVLKDNVKEMHGLRIMTSVPKAD